MTVLVAVILVVPYRFRGLAMLLTSGWAVGIGAYTITAKWHRLSDTLGADLIALMVGAGAALILAKLGRLERVTRPLRTRIVLVIGLSAVGTVFVTIGLVLASAALRYSLTDQVVEWDACLAAHSLALAGSIYAALIYWWTWRRIAVKVSASS